MRTEGPTHRDPQQYRDSVHDFQAAKNTATRMMKLGKGTKLSKDANQQVHILDARIKGLVNANNRIAKDIGVLETLPDGVKLTEKGPTKPKLLSEMHKEQQRITKAIAKLNGLREKALPLKPQQDIIRNFPTFKKETDLLSSTAPKGNNLPARFDDLTKRITTLRNKRDELENNIKLLEESKPEGLKKHFANSSIQELESKKETLLPKMKKQLENIYSKIASDEILRRDEFSKHIAKKDPGEFYETQILPFIEDEDSREYLEHAIAKEVRKPEEKFLVLATLDIMIRENPGLKLSFEDKIIARDFIAKILEKGDKTYYYSPTRLKKRLDYYKDMMNNYLQKIIEYPDIERALKRREELARY